MTHYSLEDAKNHLRELIDEAQLGKPVYILNDENQTVQLVPVKETLKPRKAGSARGQVKMADDFDAPLDDFSTI